MSERIRWAIVGLGGMAGVFARDLAALGSEACLQAVGSSSQHRADDFAAQFGASAAYAGTAALLADPNVDAVDIATTNDLHAAAARAALVAGRPILVEKPFARSASETSGVLALAAAHGVLAMEAMWTLCLPVYDCVRAWLGAGRIGLPRQVTARFCFRAVDGDSPP